MIQRTLDIAFWNYDRIRLLTDGTVPVEGVEPRFHTARIVTEIFKAMVRPPSRDVSNWGSRISCAPSRVMTRRSC